MVEWRTYSHSHPFENLSFLTTGFDNFLRLLQNDPVIPAFPDLHLSPAAIMKELSMYFQKFSSQTRLLTIPAPHELPPREAQEYPLVDIYTLSFMIITSSLTLAKDFTLHLFCEP